MSVSNIATCFAPCVFKSENALQMIEDSPATNRIVQLLISNANTIFQVFFTLRIFFLTVRKNRVSKMSLLGLRKRYMSIRG